MGNWATGVGHGTPAKNSKDAAPSDKPPYPKFVQTEANIKMTADSEHNKKIVTPSAL